MRALQSAALVCTDVLVRLLPRGLLRSLALSMSRRDPGLLTRTVTTAQRDLGRVRLPTRISGFEDLAFLFWTTPMNRGVLRQDFDEAAALYRRVRSVPNPRGVEIGRYAGGSTILIASAMVACNGGDGGGGRLTSIDIAPRDDEALREALSRLGLLRHVELLAADASRVAFDEPLDFVFIDGDHSYEAARRDHETWGRLVKVGGYVIHHDMGHGRAHATTLPPLARLRREIEEAQSELELVEEAGSLVIFRRVSDAWAPLPEPTGSAGRRATKAVE